MLYHHLLSEALTDKREDFRRFVESWREELGDYARQLCVLLHR